MQQFDKNFIKNRYNTNPAWHVADDMLPRSWSKKNLKLPDDEKKFAIKI